MHTSLELPDLPRVEISVSETPHDAVAEEVQTRNDATQMLSYNDKYVCGPAYLDHRCLYRSPERNPEHHAIRYQKSQCQVFELKRRRYYP